MKHEKNRHKKPPSPISQMRQHGEAPTHERPRWQRH